MPWSDRMFIVVVGKVHEKTRNYKKRLNSRNHSPNLHLLKKKIETAASHGNITLGLLHLSGRCWHYLLSHGRYLSGPRGLRRCRLPTRLMKTIHSTMAQQSQPVLESLSYRVLRKIMSERKKISYPVRSRSHWSNISPLHEHMPSLVHVGLELWSVFP